MPSRICLRHPKDYPCTCAMGNLYRFVEPVLLYLLSKRERAYGYELSGEMAEHALTDAEIEIGTLYRTLRQLEKNGCVKSKWDTGRSGPARRQYMLTLAGREHLAEWIRVLEHLSESMRRFTETAQGSRPELERSGAPRQGSLPNLA